MKTRIFNLGLCLLLCASAASAQNSRKTEREMRKTERSADRKLNSRSFSNTITSISSKAEKLATTIATRFEEDFGPFDGDWPSSTGSSTEIYSDENSSSSVQNDDDARKTKRFVKTYSVDSGDKLQIDNQYGKVSINTWAKNEFKVDVEIKAYASSNDKAEEQLKSVTIVDSKNGDIISFKTNFESGGKWWNNNMWAGESNNKRGTQINYTVYMPSKNSLAITNKFGSININDFDGPVSIRSSYGSLKAGSLNNGSCNVSSSNGSAVIENIGGGSIKCSYGSLNLTSANNIDAELRYGSARIGSLKGTVKMNVDYVGGLKIGSLNNSLKSLDIDASYSGITIGNTESANFNFDITAKYSGFNYDRGRVANLVVNPDENERGFNPTKNYKGRFGKGGGNVRINSSYTSVKIE